MLFGILLASKLNIINGRKKDVLIQFIGEKQINLNNVYPWLQEYNMNIEEKNNNYSEWLRYFRASKGLI